MPNRPSRFRRLQDTHGGSEKRNGVWFDRQNMEGEMGSVGTVSYSCSDLYQQISFVDDYFNRYCMVW